MANNLSAKKRIRQNEKRRIRNRYFKTTARTYIKQARTLIETGELEDAEAAVQQAIRSLDKAAQKGCIHKNKAARSKSRLVKALKSAKAEAVMSDE